jgi:hypothetical protein
MEREMEGVDRDREEGKNRREGGRKREVWNEG